MNNIAICICVLIYSIVINSCTNGTRSLLDVKEKELYSAQVPHKNYKVKVVYLPSNATIQSAFQVRKQFKDKEETAETYERYNFMDTCNFVNDTTFILVIRDTISILGNKPDTMIIKQIGRAHV